MCAACGEAADKAALVVVGGGKQKIGLKRMSGGGRNGGRKGVGS